MVARKRTFTQKYFEGRVYLCVMNRRSIREVKDPRREPAEPRIGRDPTIFKREQFDSHSR